MDFSRLHRAEALGVVSALVLAFSLLALTWFSLDPNPTREAGEGFICGEGNFSCTGFETFPILRWLLLAGCAAPLILSYIVASGHKLSYPPGEMTMSVGATAFILIAYNGIIDKPGTGVEEIGISLDIGYWLALVAALAIAVAGFWRADMGQRKIRKPPGSV